jgi:GTP cyclohydrolase I
VDRDAAAKAIEAFLCALGRDPEREPELVGTGARVADAFVDQLLDGYRVDVDALLSQSVIAATTDLVIVRDLAVTTMCPHHLLPALGTATVAFAPGEYLIGVGVVGTLVDAFAHRFALQEHIGDRVVAALQKHLAPEWAGCRLVLSHGCMTARGDRKHAARVETVALSGGDIDEAVAYQILGVGR